MDPDRNENSGWYPDPYQLAELRYFDGEAWSDFVMTDGVPAQVPTDDPHATPRGRPVDPAPVTGSVSDRVARPPADASGDGRASAGKDRTSPPVTCAVGPCDELRVGGRSFCTRHGPQPSHRRNPGRPRGGSPTFRPKLVCPYCQTNGCVSTERVKVSVSGVTRAKATAALFTGGLSLLIGGLTDKERITRASCSNCGVSWRFV